jgi:hypothetical protein
MSGATDSTNLLQIATFNLPSSISTDMFGNILVCEPAGRVRLISTSWNFGIVQPFPDAYNPCSVGAFCAAGVTIAASCPQFHHCPTLGLGSPTPCPVGRICPELRMITATLCPAGSFCSVTGLSAANGNCSAGFYCEAGSGNQFGGML